MVVTQHMISKATPLFHMIDVSETFFALEIWIPIIELYFKKERPPKHDKVQLKW
jgi:hypothetical protein